MLRRHDLVLCPARQRRGHAQDADAARGRPRPPVCRLGTRRARAVAGAVQQQGAGVQGADQDLDAPGAEPGRRVGRRQHGPAGRHPRKGRRRALQLPARARVYRRQGADRQRGPARDRARARAGAEVRERRAWLAEGAGRGQAQGRGRGRAEGDCPRELGKINQGRKEEKPSPYLSRLELILPS
jgi:hypothetical protein